MVRNAVDHGLERGAAQGRATIYLSTKHQHGQLVVELSDNGRGVDWAKVARKAEEQGLARATRTDLVEALFSDGLSTRDEATEYSGRGVGMSAVRAECEARGGSWRSKTGQHRCVQHLVHLPRCYQTRAQAQMRLQSSDPIREQDGSAVHWYFSNLRDGLYARSHE
ncbi:MAG: hypothetical protein RLZZ450_5471 [Pseudomonadota bacterium]